MIKGLRLLGLLLLGMLVGCEPSTDVAPAKPDQKKAEKQSGTDAKEMAVNPPTHKVEKGPFKIDVTLKGVFEAGQMTEVSLGGLEAWTPQTGGPLLIKRVIEHGTTIRRGETLIRLDLDKIDQSIRDLESERHLAELAIQQAHDELPLLEKATAQELAAAERAHRQADEDLKNWPQDRALLENSARIMVVFTKFFLESAKEELRQLEKMYRAKDLTEETEEIILRRQRKVVEIYTAELKIAEGGLEQMLKVELPRREQNVRDKTLKQALVLEKARATLPLALNQKRLALDKLKYERGKAATRLAKLHRDREAMTVKAPADGIVFHGKCIHGQWTESGAPGSRLHAGSIIQGEETLLTIVQPRPLWVQAVVEEKELAHIHPGMKAKVVAVAHPDLKLPAKLEAVSAVPVTPGHFQARWAVELGKEAAALMPGMACSVKFVPYQKENTLTVPAAAVFAEELDEDRHYVYLAKKDGKPEKRTVIVGKKTIHKVEILEGLKEGDAILLEKPGDPKKAAPATKELVP